MDKTKFNKKSDWRNFGFVLAVFLSVVATVLLLKGSGLYGYFYGGGVLAAFLALVLPVVLKPVFIVFTYVGLAMGFVMTRLILGSLFYLVVTPMTLR